MSLNIFFGNKKRQDFHLAFLNMVGTERLELSRIAALEPKSSASTNFATSPNKKTTSVVFLNKLAEDQGFEP
jgi:hypothetical protein